MGRLDDALEEMRLAQSLDPVSSIVARDLAVVHAYASRRPSGDQASWEGSTQPSRRRSCVHRRSRSASGCGAMGCARGRLGMWRSCPERMVTM
jgi:hypothetical protein